MLNSTTSKAAARVPAAALQGPASDANGTAKLHTPTASDRTKRMPPPSAHARRPAPEAPARGVMVRRIIGTMPQPRVAITGIGVVSPFGVGRDLFWDRISR